MKYLAFLCLVSMACEGGKGGPLPDARAADARPVPDAREPDAPPVVPFLDPTFGENGVVTTALLKSAYRAASTTSDAFYVGGEARAPAGACGIARFAADGAIDPAFGTDGIATLQFPDSSGCQLGGLAVQGTSVLVGARVFTQSTVVVLCRLTAAGDLDATFGNAAAGVAGCAATDSTLAAYGIAVLPDQTIHFGANWDLHRFSANGALQGTLSIFSDDPVYVRPREAGGIFVAALASGGVEVTAYSTTHAPIAAYGSDGIANATLRLSGDFAMNLRGDDRVLVAAAASDDQLGLLQLTPAGEADPAWGTGGLASFDVLEGIGEADVGALAIRPNGDAYVFTGNRVLGVDSAAARLAGFGTDGVVQAPGFGYMTDTVVQSTGKVVAVGMYNDGPQIVRFP